MARATGTRRVSPRWKGGSLQAFSPARGTTGAGTAYDLRQGMAVISANCIGGSAACRLSLQGSQDGVVWNNIKTGRTASAAGTLTPSTMTSTPWQFVRGVITTATTGGATVQMQITAKP